MSLEFAVTQMNEAFSLAIEKIDEDAEVKAKARLLFPIFHKHMDQLAAQYLGLVNDEETMGSLQAHTAPMWGPVEGLLDAAAVLAATDSNFKEDVNLEAFQELTKAARDPEEMKNQVRTLIHSLRSNMNAVASVLSEKK